MLRLRNECREPQRRRGQPKRQYAPGFTLIELLVVVSVIIIVAAIFFPVFARAREQARQARCLSNLRQISLAVMVYAQDYDEMLPRDVTWCISAARTDPCGQTDPDRRIEAQIESYVRNTELWVCPSATTPPVTWDRGQAVCSRDGLGYPDFMCIPGDATHGISLSYGWNDWVFALCLDPSTGSCHMPGVLLAAVTTPDSKVMMADARTSYLDFFTLAFANYPGESASSAANVGKFWTEFAQRRGTGPDIVPGRDTRHQMGQNVVFLDGHARWLPYQAFIGLSAQNLWDRWFDYTK